MKLYKITCSTNVWSASRTTAWKHKEVLEYNGITPVVWVHDDDFGDGFTLEDARRRLDDIARQSREECCNTTPRRHFEMSYWSDPYTYRIVEL